MNIRHKILGRVPHFAVGKASYGPEVPMATALERRRVKGRADCAFCRTPVHANPQAASVLKGIRHVTSQVVRCSQVASEKTDITVHYAFKNYLAFPRAELTSNL